MVTFNIDPDKIRDVIGTGGKVINDIIAKCDTVKIDVDDSGKITIYHTNKAMIEKAKAMIDDIVREAKVGEIYEGKVTRVEEYGAFVNLFGDTDGLCHVSRLDWKYIDNANNFCKVGDTMKVVVIGLDEKGKVKLSHREFLEKPADYVERPERPAGDRPHTGGFHGHSDHLHGHNPSLSRSWNASFGARSFFPFSPDINSGYSPFLWRRGIRMPYIGGARSLASCVNSSAANWWHG
jgi:predicted RNA-binding protein with RPS1 domain